MRKRILEHFERNSYSLHHSAIAYDATQNASGRGKILFQTHRTAVNPFRLQIHYKVNCFATNAIRKATNHTFFISANSFLLPWVLPNLLDAINDFAFTICPTSNKGFHFWAATGATQANISQFKPQWPRSRARDNTRLPFFLLLLSNHSLRFCCL